MGANRGKALRPLIKRPKDVGGCWEWLGPKSSTGHGKKTFLGRDMYAHRWVWELFFGAVPEGLVVYVTCGTIGCVNPFHLKCGTQAENTRQGANSSLLPEEVHAIRAAKRTGNRAVALMLSQRHGCSLSTIYDIWTGRTWRKGKPFHGANRAARAAAHSAEAERLERLAAQSKGH